MFVFIDDGEAVCPHRRFSRRGEAAGNDVARFEALAPFGALPVPADLLEAHRLQQEDAGQVGPPGGKEFIRPQTCFFFFYDIFFHRFLPSVFFHYIGISAPPREAYGNFSFLIEESYSRFIDLKT